MSLPAFLIVDLETTGLDSKVDKIIEVGGVLFDPVLGVPVESQSQILKAADNPAVAVNRIPSALLQAWGVEEPPIRMLDGMLARAEARRNGVVMVAHNAAFDRQWMPIGWPWICTYEDAVWPRVPRETGSLATIALAYDVGIIRAHRAIEDCLTLAAVLTRVHEIESGLDDWFGRAIEPREELIAEVSYHDRQVVKDERFQWDGDRKVWWKRVRESLVDSYVDGLSFRVRRGC